MDNRNLRRSARIRSSGAAANIDYTDALCDYCNQGAQSEVLDENLGLCDGCLHQLNLRRGERRQWTPPPNVDVSNVDLVGAGMQNGLYATADIQPGEIIAELTGRVIDEHKCEEVTAMGPPYRVIILKDGQSVLPDTCDASFVNHSCVPNAEFLFRTYEDKHKVPRQQILIICGPEPIRRDSEITVKYNMEYGDEVGDIRCLCGSENCIEFFHKKRS
jgi:hypothetical protein